MRFVLDDKILLGRGLFTEIFHGSLDSDTIAAKKSQVKELLEREADFLKLFGHPNVVQYKGWMCFQDESYLIMELARGGNLRENLGLKKFSRGRNLSLVRQICLGLEYIHSLEIMHRDIKAENLLLKDDQRIVIADFAMAQHRREKPRKHDIVTDAAYSFKSDVYLLALVVFQLLEDRRNANRSTLAAEIQRQSQEGGLDPKIFDNITWEEAIMGALYWQPEARPTVARFREAFSH